MARRRLWCRIMAAVCVATVIVAASGCTGQTVTSQADPAPMQAVSASDDSGKWDNIFEFKPGDDGYIVIAYKGEGGEAEIPAIYRGEPVTAIGDGAFVNSDRLISLVIPEGVISIGDSAFYGCDRLTNVDIPSTVTEIGQGAFTKCVSLKSVKLPEGITAISISTFYGCTALESVNIPESVTSIGISAFNYCDSIGTLTIPDSVTSIAFRAFWECTITVKAPHDPEYYGYPVDRHVTWVTEE